MKLKQRLLAATAVAGLVGAIGLGGDARAGEPTAAIGYYGAYLFPSVAQATNPGESADQRAANTAVALNRARRVANALGVSLGGTAGLLLVAAA